VIVKEHSTTPTSYRKLLSSKIHRATVTEANRDYEGSITLPYELIQAAKLVEHEAVAVWDITNGNRIETYVIKGPAGSQEICINGAAAHLVRPGDLVIIAAFSWLPVELLAEHQPVIVFVDQNNQITRIGLEQPRQITV
jgi:aspartate 1-decarboxylase